MLDSELALKNGANVILPGNGQNGSVETKPVRAEAVDRALSKEMQSNALILAHSANNARLSVVEIVRREASKAVST